MKTKNSSLKTKIILKTKISLKTKINLKTEDQFEDEDESKVEDQSVNIFWLTYILKKAVFGCFALIKKFRSIFISLKNINETTFPLESNKVLLTSKKHEGEFHNLITNEFINMAQIFSQKLEA